MFRHIHPTDSPRLLAFKQAAGRAEACALPQAIQGASARFPAVTYAGIALSPRAWQSCWVVSDGGRILAVVRAGPRSGPLAWEIRDLYVHRAHVHGSAEVLEDLAIPAGKSGARRIFLRLPQGSPLYDQARSAGYMAAGSETVYRTASAADAAGKLGTPDIRACLRPRTSLDDDALFRLYCASTPVALRLRRGQDVSEWIDASENPGARTMEWVLDGDDGRVMAFLRTADLRAGRYFLISWSRDMKEDASGLVASALASTRGNQAAVTVVPTYDEGLAGLVEDIGFEPVQTYDVLAKILTVPVMETGRAVAAVG
ncbi:MAG: hypothetical protein EXR57_01000 [Dehalococcoidia bacterium]|nr:hypothetical protein [Dehalococcoidia bacterium]